MNTASNLNIPYNKLLPQNKDISEIVEHAIKSSENHSSIVAIKKIEIQIINFLLNLLQRKR